MLDLSLQLAGFEVLFKYLGVRVRQEAADAFIILAYLLKIVLFLNIGKFTQLVLTEPLALVYRLPKLLPFFLSLDLKQFLVVHFQYLR